MNLEREWDKTYYLKNAGLEVDAVMQEDGTVTAQSIDPTAETLGMADVFGGGVKPDIYALSQAAGAPVTEAEVAGTMAGFVPGKIAGAIGAPGDIAALATGIYKAAFPEPEQGRLEAFITQVEEISNKFGSGATLGFLDDWATQSGISEEAKQGFLQGAEVGSFFGFGQGAKATGKGVVAAGKAVVEGAPARIAERGEGVTLGMGVDPMAPIDEAIVGAQKALQKPTKENPVTAVPPTETEPGIIAFHGSGADFDQFSLEKIGTGEGAQAYGYGLYFTDNEDIAKFYRQTVGGGSVVKNWSIGNLDLVKRETYRDYSPGATPFGRGPYKPVSELSPKDYAQAIMLENLFIREADLFSGKKGPYGEINEPLEGDDLEAAVVNIIRDTKNNLDADDAEGIAYLDNVLEDIKWGRSEINFEAEQLGKTYKVGLAPKPEDMLDYEKSISEQSQKVQDALYANEEIASIIKRKQKEDGLPPEFYTGEELYADLAENLQSSQAASNEFADAGILGLKYRAAGSRGAAIDEADVEKNYVIFDDKAIKILEKYGIVGPVAITALGAAKQEGEDNANST